MKVKKLEIPNTDERGNMITLHNNMKPQTKLKLKYLLEKRKQKPNLTQIEAVDILLQRAISLQNEIDSLVDDFEKEHPKVGIFIHSMHEVKQNQKKYLKAGKHCALRVIAHESFIDSLKPFI